MFGTLLYMKIRYALSSGVDTNGYDIMNLNPKTNNNVKKQDHHQLTTTSY